RERLRGKLEAAEQECARLRQEIGELRKEVADLQSETTFFRGEHAAMAEALREVIEHVSQVQRPLNDVFRRLQVTQPALSQAAAGGRAAAGAGGRPAKTGGSGGRRPACFPPGGPRSIPAERAGRPPPASPSSLSAARTPVPP